MSSTGKSTAGWKPVGSKHPLKQILLGILKSAVPGCTKVTMVMQARDNENLYRGDCLVKDGDGWTYMGTFTVNRETGVIGSWRDSLHKIEVK